MAELTITIEEAVKQQRHVGVSAEQYQALCRSKKVAAVKIGKHWHMQIKGLNRLFLGYNTNQ